MPVGIDIGKAAVQVATATPGSPRTYPTKAIRYSPTWEADLIEAVTRAGDPVVLEPTGWHLSRPVILTLTRAGFTVWQVTHSVSNKYRELHFGNKTDANDSKALASIAAELAAGRRIRGLKPAADAEQVLHIRLYVNEFTRLTRDMVRAKNRLAGFTHAADPAGAKSIEKQLKRENIVWPPHVNVVLAEMTWRASHDLQAAAQRAAESRARLDELMKEHPIAQLWATIPYYSPVFAAALLVACDGMPQHLTRNEFTAAVGRRPRLEQSGASNFAKPNRPGYRPAMQALHLWTFGLLSPNAGENPIKSYFRGDTNNDVKRKMNAAKTKLARLLHHLAVTGTPYRPEADPTEGDADNAPD